MKTRMIKVRPFKVPRDPFQKFTVRPFRVSRLPKRDKAGRFRTKRKGSKGSKGGGPQLTFL